MTKIIIDIDTAVREITEGNIVALPTETVYGLGANALNENAVVKIFEAKERPVFNPLIVHVHDTDEFEKYGKDIPDEVYKLAERFSPGPITYIVKKKSIIPDIVTSGNDSVGLRIPSHEMFREVIKLSGVPVSAPSANRSGKISPTTAAEVMKELDGKIDFILDGGKCKIGIESTVVSFLENEISILRHGFITREDIEKVTGKINIIKNGKIISPGQMKIHYAPFTPLYITEDADEIKNVLKERAAVLDLKKFADKREIALNLFSELRHLDEMKFEMIIAEKTDGEGIGAAINDRLERASSGKIKIINSKIRITE
ncbi:MAG: threonylcarbamoyl-AMP synthase [Ignavibacteria bacterium]|nr:threonylcarbamoyl-AMP synthase [Ignavibacteria bacterium]